MQDKKHRFFKIGAILMIAVLLVSLDLVHGAAVSQNLTFTPSADAYVDASQSGTNFGTGLTLREDSTPVVNSFARFTVSGLGGKPVTQAVLRVHANSASTSGITVKSVADNTWGETTLTSANQPAQGSTLATSPAVVSGSWISLDVSAFVKGEGTFSLGISTPGSTAISLSSRESGANAPQLVVTVTDVATPTVPPAPTNTPINPPTNTPVNTPISGSNLTLVPAADAYVDASYANTNYGTGLTLRTDASPVVNSFVRFSVPALNGAAITSAQLRVHANTGSTSGITAKSVTNNTWGETTITSANQPAQGSSFSTSPAVISGSWITFDVTSFVTGQGSFSFGISTPGSTAISLSSRESGANAPQLVLSFNGSIPPTSTPPAATATAVITNTPVPPTATAVITNTPIPPTATSPSATSTPSGTSCTAVILTKGPTLIFTGDNTKMRVFWQWTANVTFQVQWGTSTGYTSGNAAVNTTDTTNHLYTYDIGGLTPGTKYFYRVVVGSQCASSTFYAAPAANATSVKFTSYGDTRTNGSAHNGLAGQVNALFTADPAFQTLNLSVGDWVSGDSESAWTGEWFNPSYTNIRKQDASIADIGVRGNHESGATYWKRYWPEPFQSGGLYWSFDYGPLHVVMLDQYTSYSAGSAQYNWLKADLAASTKTWKIVVLHEPGWSAGGGHANNTSVQQNLQPLFVQYGVSIVFGGHNHYYARAMVNGVAHLTVGGGGAPLYTPASGQPYIVTATSVYSFGEFTISGNTLTAKIVSNSGSVVDSFTITK